MCFVHLVQSIMLLKKWIWVPEIQLRLPAALQKLMEWLPKDKNPRKHRKGRERGVPKCVWKTGVMGWRGPAPSPVIFSHGNSARRNSQFSCSTCGSCAHGTAIMGIGEITLLHCCSIWNAEWGRGPSSPGRSVLLSFAFCFLDNILCHCCGTEGNPASSF